jgi:hypothetical protein
MSDNYETNIKKYFYNDLKGVVDKDTIDAFVEKLDAIAELNGLLQLKFLFSNPKISAQQEFDKNLLKAYLKFHDACNPDDAFVNNPDQTQDNTGSAIHCLIYSPEFITTYEEHVNNKCNLNMRNNLSGTPIEDAVAMNRIDVVKYLFDRTHHSQNLIAIAIINHVVNHIDPQIQDSRNSTKCCEYLLAKGVPIPSKEELIALQMQTNATNKDLKKDSAVLLSHLTELKAKQIKQQAQIELKTELFATNTFENFSASDKQILLEKFGDKVKLKNHLKAYIPAYAIDDVMQYVEDENKWSELAKSIARTITSYTDNFNEKAQKAAIENFRNTEMTGKYIDRPNNVAYSVMISLNSTDFKLKSDIRGQISTQLITTHLPRDVDMNTISHIAAGMIAGVYNVNTIFTDKKGIPGILTLAIQDAAMELSKDPKISQLSAKELQILGKNIGKDLKEYLEKNKKALENDDLYTKGLQTISKDEISQEIVTQAEKTLKNPTATKEVKIRNNVVSIIRKLKNYGSFLNAHPKKIADYTESTTTASSNAPSK